MIHDIKSILVEAGYEILDFNGSGVIKIKDLECGITITCVLEDNIFFMSVYCKSIKDVDLTLDISRSLLVSDNGISTSFFNINKKDESTYMITLNNFCKLQDLGDDDTDDILSCLNFLSVDLIAAKNLLEQ